MSRCRCRSSGRTATKCRRQIPQRPDDDALPDPRPRHALLYLAAHHIARNGQGVVPHRGVPRVHLLGGRVGVAVVSGDGRPRSRVRRARLPAEVPLHDGPWARRVRDVSGGGVLELPFSLF